MLYSLKRHEGIPSVLAPFYECVINLLPKGVGYSFFLNIILSPPPYFCAPYDY